MSHKFRGKSGSNKKPGANNIKPEAKPAPVEEVVSSSTTPATTDTPAPGSPVSSDEGVSKFFPQFKLSSYNPGQRVKAAGQKNYIELSNNVHTENGGFRPPLMRFGELASRTPVVMRLDVQTYFGGSANAGSITSPLSQALLRLKQYIDTQYGMVQRYDSYDLGPYLMAIADCHTLAAEIARDIRLLSTTFYQIPAFYPTQVLDALEICSPAELDRMRNEVESGDHHTVPDPGSAVTWYTQRISYLTDEYNRIVTLLNHLPVPAELPLFGYNNDLYSCIYTDSSDTMTAQQYLFASTGTWVYSEPTDAEAPGVGSKVVYTEWPWIEGVNTERWKTLDEMLERLNLMVTRVSSAYTSSSTFLQQIANAYSSSQLVRVPLLDNPREPVPRDFNAGMAISIANATLCDQVWPCTYRADAWQQRIVGCPFIIDDPGTTNIYKSNMIDIPLQFNCAESDVTSQMIGRALRFHPSFQCRSREVVYTGEEDGVIRNIVTTGGFHGFAIVQRLVLWTLDDRGELSGWSVNHREIEENRNYLDIVRALQDWNYAPSLISGTYSYSDTMESFRINWYTGGRDIEITLAQADVMNWWTGLTEYAWGTNLLSTIRGTRTK